MRLAYADPPYPGKAHLYPENTEVDHAALVARLSEFDGWAISTDSQGLRTVLAHCPADVCVGAWIRTNAPPFNPDGRGPVRSWEPLIYVPARVTQRLDPERVRDVVHAGVPSGVHSQQGITGTKPEAFARWMFSLIGATCDDDLTDIFPGSGAIGAAWAKWKQQPSLLTPALGGHRSGEMPSKALRDSALMIEDAA